MKFRRDSLTAGFLVVVMVVAGSASAAGQSLTDIRGRLADVRTEHEAVASRLDETQARLQALHAQTDELEREQQRLRVQVAEADAEIEAILAQVAARIRTTYMHGASLDPVAIFLASDDPAGALSRAETIRWIVAGDRARVEDLAAARARGDAAQQRLDASIDELATATNEFAGLTAALEADLAELAELEAGLSAQERDELARLERERRAREARAREEAARQARLAAERDAAAAPVDEPAPPPPSGALVCPIGRPHSFIDSWGFPRSGGRRHRGTDMMSPHGTDITAITDGVWTHQRRGRSAGIWGILRGDNGTRYWYLHLSSHVAGNGQRVRAGERIATNGSTGNATTPHLHFELHPGGGSAVNPYPVLREIC